MVDFVQSRTRMVDNQLRTNDITDLRILSAMSVVPRERFVPEGKEVLAYIDEDIAVTQDQSRAILKPHIFGKLVQLANVGEKNVVLVVGATTGYCVAVLSKLAESVVGIDQDAELVETASGNLEMLGIENAAVVEAKLTDGYAADAPYDVIFINGAVEELPATLSDQLRDGGRLVCIEGKGSAASAMLYKKSGTNVSGVFGFNASAKVLPGFEKPAEFNF